MVKNLPVKQEMQGTLVQSVGWQESLEEEMAIHSSILAWKIPWTEESLGYHLGVAELDTTEHACRAKIYYHRLQCLHYFMSNLDYGWLFFLPLFSNMQISSNM